MRFVRAALELTRRGVCGVAPARLGGRLGLWTNLTAPAQCRLMSRKTIKNGGKKYKFKPKRAAKKRFALTAAGKVKVGKAGRRHLAQAVAGKRGNNLAKTGYVSDVMAKNVRRMLVNSA